MSIAATTTAPVRPLAAGDLERVIGIDAAVTGRQRRGFFEKRLEAALANPKGFIYTGHDAGPGLDGFLMCRLLGGEFGGTAPVAVLDAMAVAPERQGRGVGRALLDAALEVLRHKGIGEIWSQADWRSASLLRFFAAAGFLLAPRYILERDADARAVEASAEPEEQETREIDYGRPAREDYAALSRDAVPCRTMRREDLPAIVKIDRKVTGHDRAAYCARKLDEALEESGIRVSLVAECDGSPVGFVMARVDFGEFGRTEPYAVLDTIGVDPDFAGRRIGTALLSQLVANLATLRVERIRTEVGYDRHGLAAFLQRHGFAPAQQLAFSLRVS